MAMLAGVGQRDIRHRLRSILRELGRFRIRIDGKLMGVQVGPEGVQIAPGRLAHARHVAIGATQAEVPGIILVRFLLPVTTGARLHNPFIRIHLFIGVQGTGVGIVTGNAGKGEMLGIVQAIVMDVLLFKPIHNVNDGRIFPRMALAA
jgi:hypothetical protein